MTETQTAYEWCAELDVRVVRADGWIEDETSLHHPIDRDEFVRRLEASVAQQGPKCEIWR